ncbi:ABC-2 type transporter [Dillenia turbinata]|uniref:ABC-2 type transporter n=1 Tax=Dillenia turbinata TaxID=194707 RepID=A0AAN8VAX4_9MAGN
MAPHINGHRHRDGRGDAVIDIGKPLNYTGGLEFSSLTYTVTKKQKIDGSWTSQEVDLLHRITGYAPKGCITAVMGPSGAGKSTFLDGLAGRIARGSLKGRVSLDGVGVTSSLIKRTSAYIMQDDRLFPMLTVYETLMFAADFRLGPISRDDKRERVERLIEQLGLSVETLPREDLASRLTLNVDNAAVGPLLLSDSFITIMDKLIKKAPIAADSRRRVPKTKRTRSAIAESSRNTYIGDEGTRGVSGGERRRVSIGVDIIHGPSLLFLDEPTSGLDSTSAHSVIEKVNHIARSGSTVILTIHQPSSRIQLLLDHLIILARGELMYQGSPKDVSLHLGRMGRKVPKGESSIEYLIDVIQQYDQSEHGVRALAEFALTGMRPPQLSDEEMSVTSPLPSPAPPPRKSSSRGDQHGSYRGKSGKRLHLEANWGDEFDSSIRSPGSRSWSASQSGIVKTLRFTPSHPGTERKLLNHMNHSPVGYYANSNDILPGTLTPHSSDYSVNEDDYLTPNVKQNNMAHYHLGPKFANSFIPETWILMRRNFINIRRTPELFLSRLMVLTIMGFMMATMFLHPKADLQGITNRLSFFIFTVCLFFFSSNDAVPAFIQERFIFVRETSHNAYRASSYTIAGLITYLPFLAVQAGIYAGIVWFALELRGSFLYFLVVLYMSLLSTNSFVIFVSSVVPNYILGYAAVIAFTALFFLFCGYFLNSHDIPPYWVWMNKISTMTYPYEGLLMNQYQTNQILGNFTDGSYVTGVGILQGLHINSDDKKKKWELVIIMIGWAVLYRIFFYLILRFASKNQRT